jgi:AcrR family transcriptional regulator
MIQAMDRDERRAAAREGILAAAHRQVAEGGCASASIVAVAERAGVAAGSIYRHFPSRAELLAEVLTNATGRAHALFAARADDPSLPPPQRLAACVTVFTERALADRGLAYALHAEPAEPEVLRARAAGCRAYAQTLASLLRTGAAAGDWPAADADAQAAALVGALLGALVGPLADDRLGPRPDAAADVRTLVAFALKAVGGTGAPG